jgi:hypothetical protein
MSEDVHTCVLKSCQVYTRRSQCFLDTSQLQLATARYILQNNLKTCMLHTNETILQMGNENVAHSMTKALNEIFLTDCHELDIGERTGLTSYIDFIRPEELVDTPVMKGKDAFERSFIVFKSEVQIDGKNVRLFTIFFQRYKTTVDDEVLYHTAGHYGTHMFDTTGGASLMQMILLRDLLHAGAVELSVEKMTQCCVGYRDHLELKQLDPSTIDTIKLGWSDD